MNKAIITLCASAVMFCTLATAGDFDKQIEARQGYMKILGLNVGILSNMTRGKTPYDADLAATAAANLMHAAAMNNAAMWPAGSDMDSNDNTVAKAELWANFADAGMILQDFASTTAVLSNQAGNGLDALKASFGDVGKVCSACHKKFRAKR